MFLEQWQALSGRIRGLVQAWQLSTSGSVWNGLIATQLQQQGAKIVSDLEGFSKSFDHLLPQSAIDAIKNCISKDVYNSPGHRLVPHATTTFAPDEWQKQIWTSLVLLAAFETEMTFLLSDTQEAIRARAERAFAHLQRLIVVDAATREQWKSALKEGETSCEALGAVHLLWHGLFAFKANAAGGRTDLVFPQRPVDGLREQHYADGLVLTEWKVTHDGDDPLKKFAEAREQAKFYTQGVLAGIELTTVRYAVVVSSQYVDRPADAQVGTAVYRHINIATDPETPAKAARKSAMRPRSPTGT